MAWFEKIIGYMLSYYKQKKYIFVNSELFGAIFLVRQFCVLVSRLLAFL